MVYQSMGQVFGNTLMGKFGHSEVLREGQEIMSTAASGAVPISTKESGI